MGSGVPVTELFLVVLIAIFSVPYLIWRVGRTDDWAPLVVIQIVCGILLGPGILGAVFPAVHASIFVPPVIAALNGVAWWSVMLFVFLAGLELDLGDAWKSKRETSITAISALAMPMIFGAGAAFALLELSEPALWMGAQGQPWQFIVGIGMACAVTALPILVLFLEKLGHLRSEFGQRVLRYASLDDLMIWGVLAVILLDWERTWRQLGFLVSFSILVWAFRKFIAYIPERDRWPAAIVWLAGCAYFADWAGLHYMVGAFLAGAFLESRWFRLDMIDQFRRVILLAFMPVFFLSTGLKTSWEMGGWATVIAAVLLLAAMVAGKILGVGFAGRLLGWRPGESWVIGWLLQTKALIMIIFANVLLDKDLISNGAFTALLLAAVGSTMLTIPFVKPALKRLAAAGYALDRSDTR